jgi:DNA-binding MurR/RpiR family transcriptional regulator
MPIQTILSEKRIHLTDAQRRAAQYIMDHYEEAIFLTASKLAKKAGVSEATVVRLAQVLGLMVIPNCSRCSVKTSRAV